MSIENIKKIQDIKKQLVESLAIDNEEVGEKMFYEACESMSELARKKDIDTLPELFDIFVLKDMEYTGICETLLNDIWDNFEVEQIIEALHSKFGDLIASNDTRSVQFVGYSMNCGYFNNIRAVFNKTASPHSEHFLDEFENWYSEDYPEEISILREDMKNW